MTAIRVAAAALVAAVLVASVALVGCGAAEHAAGQKYHCPMHPTYISDRAGDCPICGMRLVPIEEKVAPTTAPTYVCPMHPEVTSDRPGERCSKCGMKLVAAGDRGPGTGNRGPEPGARSAVGRKVLFYRNPMDPTITSPAPMKDGMGMDYVPVFADEASAPAGPVAGMAAVELTPEGMRLAGVQTATAVRERAGREARTVGSVLPDERSVRHVHTKIAGWVEHLSVNFTGQLVRAGEPILTIYSQQLLASQEEFLRARETAARFAASELPEVRKGGEELLAAARRRLTLFDVPESFVEELERSGTAQRAVTLLAPVSGFVTAKGTFEGQQVEPGMELFTITDLSRIWIEADFFEYEAPALKLHQLARLSLPYDPARRLDGRLQYIYPTLNPETRTLRVRFDFPNPDFALKPGMYANVEIELDGADSVVIPDSAVMDTGERQVVFVARGDGRFEPRQVSVGVRGGGKAQVLAGVAEGEAVVVRANFLLDSESRLRAAIAGATGHAGHGI
jgi:RND family efflux transporter MFP subunit